MDDRPIDPATDVSTVDVGALVGSNEAHLGRLALVRAPHATTLERDAATLASAIGTHAVAPLITDAEVRALGLTAWPQALIHAGVRVMPWAIEDMSVPDDHDRFAAFVGTLAGELREGRTVTVHCRAGLGRSGMVAACVLVHVGAAAPQAIAHVRASRPGAVETEAQEAYVAEYARRYAHTTRT